MDMPDINYKHIYYKRLVKWFLGLTILITLTVICYFLIPVFGEKDEILTIFPAVMGAFLFCYVIPHYLNFFPTCYKPIEGHEGMSLLEPDTSPVSILLKRRSHASRSN